MRSHLIPPPAIGCGQNAIGQAGYAASANSLGTGRAAMECSRSKQAAGQCYGRCPARAGNVVPSDSKQTAPSQRSATKKPCRLLGLPFQVRLDLHCHKHASKPRPQFRLAKPLREESSPLFVKAGFRAPDVEVQDPLTKVLDAHTAALPPEVQEVMNEGI